MQKPIVCTPRNKHTRNTDYTMQHKYVYELYHTSWVTWRGFLLKIKIMMANINLKWRDFPDAMKLGFVMWLEVRTKNREIWNRSETHLNLVFMHMLSRWRISFDDVLHSNLPPPIAWTKIWSMNFFHVTSNLNSAAFRKCAIRTFWNFHFLNILVVRFPGSIFTFVSNGFTDGTFTNVVQLLSNSITSCLSMP